MGRSPNYFERQLFVSSDIVDVADCLALYDLLVQYFEVSSRLRKLAERKRQELNGTCFDVAKELKQRKYFWYIDNVGEFDYYMIGLLITHRIGEECANNYAIAKNYYLVEKYDSKLIYIYEENRSSFIEFCKSIYKNTGLQKNNLNLLPAQYEKVINMTSAEG